MPVNGLATRSPCRGRGGFGPKHYALASRPLAPEGQQRMAITHAARGLAERVEADVSVIIYPANSNRRALARN